MIKTEVGYHEAIIFPPSSSLGATYSPPPAPAQGGQQEEQQGGQQEQQDGPIPGAQPIDAVLIWNRMWVNQGTLAAGPVGIEANGGNDGLVTLRVIDSIDEGNPNPALLQEQDEIQFNQIFGGTFTFEDQHGEFTRTYSGITFDFRDINGYTNDPIRNRWRVGGVSVGSLVPQLPQVTLYQSAGDSYTFPTITVENTVTRMEDPITLRLLDVTDIDPNMQPAANPATVDVRVNYTLVSDNSQSYISSSSKTLSMQSDSTFNVTINRSLINISNISLNGHEANLICNDAGQWRGYINKTHSQQGTSNIILVPGAEPPDLSQLVYTSGASVTYTLTYEACNGMTDSMQLTINNAYIPQL